MASTYSGFFYSNDDLRTLQSVFDAACAELSLSAAEPARRERLGILIFGIAEAARCESATVQRLAVLRYRHGAARMSDDAG